MLNHMHPTLPSHYLLQPTCPLFQHHPGTIQLVNLIYKLIHVQKNIAHFDAYVKSTFIYIRNL
jgi:hypothetical protein